MIHTRGMTLLELIIYLLIISIVTLLGTHWIVRMQGMIYCFYATEQRLITLHTAHDLLLRDLQQGFQADADWKRVHTDMLIWHTAQGDIGWGCEQGILVRTTGDYHAATDTWRSRTKSVVAKPDVSIRFQMGMRAEMRIIFFTIAMQGMKLQGAARPRRKGMK